MHRYSDTLMAGFVWFAVTAAGIAFGAEAVEAIKPEPATAANAAGGKSDRLREGTKLTNEKGMFEFDSAGEHAVFVLANGRKIRCLENLNLDRVWQVVHVNPDRLEWSIQGTVTEYRGANYLLVNQSLLLTRRSNNR